MWHNVKMKRYEFTKEGKKQNFGKEIFVKKNYSPHAKPCNLFHVRNIQEILTTDRILPPHFGELQGLVDYLF